LIDAILARSQTSFGIPQTVYFSFINRNVSIKKIQYYSHGSSFSQLVVCKRRNLVKAFKFSKWSGP